MGEVRRAGAEHAAHQAAARRARGLLAHLELAAHARLVQRMEASGQRAYFTQFQVRNPAEFVTRAEVSPRGRSGAGPAPASPPRSAPGSARARSQVGDGVEGRQVPKGTLVRRRSVAVLQAAELNRQVQVALGGGGGDGVGGVGAVGSRRMERRGSVFGSSMPVSLMAGPATRGVSNKGSSIPTVQRRGSVFASGLATGLDPDVEGSLRRAFSRYCHIGGDSASTSWGGSSEGLTASRFLKLSRDGGLSLDFTYAELDVLFASVAQAHRVDYKAFLGLLRQLHTILSEGSKSPSRVGGGDFQAFVEERVLRSLLRATLRKDPHEKDLMSAPLWQAIFTQEHILYIVFRFYCRLADLNQGRGVGSRAPARPRPKSAASASAAGRSPRTRKLAPEHLEKFAMNFKIVPRVVTRGGLLDALREAKSHAGADDDPSLTFTEFLECLCRCALKAKPGVLEAFLRDAGEASVLAPELTDRACVNFGQAQGVAGPADPPDPQARGVWIPVEAPTQQLQVTRPHPTPLLVPEVVPVSRYPPENAAAVTQPQPQPPPEGSPYKPVKGEGRPLDVTRVWPPCGGSRLLGRRPRTAQPRCGNRPAWQNPGATGPVDTGPRAFILVGDRFAGPGARPRSAAV